MRFMIFAAAAGLTMAAAAPAQEKAASFTPEQFRADVGFLADDLLEGRNAGDRGHDLAALYVATRFEALGLRPAADGGWYQQVPFVEHKLAGVPASLTIGERIFAQGDSVLLASSSGEAGQRIEAPVVFAGYGVDAPDQGFDDYAGLDVRGKIVALLTGTPEGLPSDVAAYLNSEKGKMAERRGAIGLVHIRTRAETERRAWSSLAKRAGDPSMNWVGSDGRPFVYAPGIRFQATLDSAAADSLFAGSRRSLGAILKEADRDGARPRGFALRQRVTVELESSSRRFTSPNVVAVLPGSDPAIAGEYVLLMAHLDHQGVDPDRQGDRIYNGAMDNATGVATMLEVARALAAAPSRPRRSILFAAVTAEEDGLLGSQYLARNPVVAGKLVGVVNLDMPVLLYDFTDVIAFGAEHSTLGPIVARAGAKMNVALAPDPLPHEGLFTRSDHYMFVREGIPAIFLMTGFAGDGQRKFTEFLATYYHQPSDAPDLPIDWRAGAKFAQLNYLIAREIADADERPLWYSDSFFGHVLAPSEAKAARPSR